jgi:hypothetical protein
MAKARETKAVAELDAGFEVEIEHPKTKERYGVTMAAYRDHYAGAGFKVDRRGDGTPITSEDDAREAPQPVGPQGPEPEVPEGGVIPVHTPETEETGQDAD